MNEIIYREEDLRTIQVTVTLGKQKYILQEADEGDAVAYNDKKLSAARLQGVGELTSVEGLSATEPFLVHRCLREAKLDEKENFVKDEEGVYLVGSRIPTNIICKWKPGIVRALFDKIQEISSLEEEETQDSLRKQIEVLQKKLEASKTSEESEKNSLSGTMHESE